MYYVCKAESLKAVKGPFGSVWDAADAVMAMPNPEAYGTMSRYALAKEGIYPRNKSGDVAILADIQAYEHFGHLMAPPREADSAGSYASEVKFEP